MKKGMCFVSIIAIVLLFSLNACGQMNSWKSAEIEGYGKIDVPEGWSVSVVDGFVYFSTEKNKNVVNTLVQYRSDEKTNAYFSDIENLKWLQDENFSNSACITKYKLEYQDGTSVEMFALCFTAASNYKSTEFLCLDASVSEEALREIAKSYSVIG